MSILDEGIEETRRQATDLIRAGRFPEAIALLQPLSISNPGDGLTWRLLGMAQGSIGELTASINSFRQAVELAPNSPQNHYNLALALKGRGELPLARKHVERALALDPQYAQAQSLLGQLPAPASAQPVAVAPPAPSPLMAPAPPMLRTDAPAPPQPPTPYGYSQGASYGNGGYAPYTPPPMLGQYQYATRGDVDGLMQKWSWDGFLWGFAGSWIWAWAHGGAGWGLSILGIGFVLNAASKATGNHAIGIISLLLQLGLAVYFGLKGNEMSWSHRDFVDVEDFKACHRIWLWWAIGLLVVFWGFIAVMIMIYLNIRQ